jgi:hypothetical protein
MKYLICLVLSLPGFVLGAICLLGLALSSYLVLGPVKVSLLEGLLEGVFEWVDKNPDKRPR